MTEGTGDPSAEGTAPPPDTPETPPDTPTVPTEPVTLRIVTPFTDGFVCEVEDRTYTITDSTPEVPVEVADRIIDTASSCGVEIEKVS